MPWQASRGEWPHGPVKADRVVPAGVLSVVDGERHEMRRLLPAKSLCTRPFRRRFSCSLSSPWGPFDAQHNFFPKRQRRTSGDAGKPRGRRLVRLLNQEARARVAVVLVAAAARHPAAAAAAVSSCACCWPLPGGLRGVRWAWG